MKKPLLLLVTAILMSFISYAQVPANNLLENATLINSFPFSDVNVRLDLATNSTISPPNCPLGNYNLVYYKFTAINSTPTQLIVSIEDANDGTVGTSFAIIYSSPSLNIADETELTALQSPCGFTTSSTIDLTEGTNYYILVHRNDADATSNITFEENQLLPVPTSERDALIALYNSTNGDVDWNDTTNWNSSEPVGTWYGVNTIMVGGGMSQVSSINLGGNNLTGSIPTQIGDFPELTYLGLWGNQLTGVIPPEIGNLTNLVTLDITPNSFTGSIPDEIGNLVNLEILWLNQNGLSGSIPTSFQNLVNLRELYLMGAVGIDENPNNWTSSSYSGDFPDLTALPLELLRMENNYFEFEDIADEFATYQANIPNFVFNPQFTVDFPEELNPEVGEDIVLTITDVTDTGRNGLGRRAANEYQWLKDDVEITDANETSFTIVNAQSTDSGVYTCQITNPDVPGFIITRTGITVMVGTLGVIDNQIEDMKVYPNPVSDIITIKMPAFSPSKVFLYDVRGRLIKTQELESETSQVDMTLLAPGMYLLKLETKTSTMTHNIIKK